MDDPFKEEILKYLSRKLRLKITESTRLNADIGLVGGDAFSLLEEFAKRYGVDFTGFEFDKYFAPESLGGCGCLSAIFIVILIGSFLGEPLVVLMWIFILSPILLPVGILFYRSSIKRKFPDLTAGHLVEVARRKVWFEPES